MRAISTAVVVGLLALGLTACDGSESATDETSATSVSTTSDASLESTTTAPTTTERSTTTTTAATTTTTTRSPVTIPGWTAVPATFDDVTLTAGAERGGRHVTVGCRRDVATSTDRNTLLPIWWSDDVATWQRSEGPPGVACLKQVAATPLGFFAVGNAHQLMSDDGVVWSALELHEELGLEYAGQLGWVHAVFVSPQEDRVTLLYTRAAENESTMASLVSTTDGETWELGPADSAALFDSSGIADVAAGGDGLLAVGSSPGGEFVPTAAVFTSPDGLTWRRLTPRNAAFNDAIMTAIAAVDGGYVAVGGDFFVTGLMTAWTSPDGLDWTRSAHPDETTDPNVAFMTAEAVTVDGSRVWASGIDSDARRGDDPPLPALWVSTDAGATWRRTEIPTGDAVVPFVILETGETALATWPPPLSVIEEDALLLRRDAG